MTGRTLSFTVAGLKPAKQGDYVAQKNRKTGQTFVRPKNDAHNQAWRKAVRASAREAMTAQSWPPRNRAWVRVVAAFYFDRPLNHYGTGRNANRLREDAPPFPGQPDTDKLQRALGDALTLAEVIADDALIARWVADRLWTPQRGRIGAVIRLVELTDHTQLTIGEDS